MKYFLGFLRRIAKGLERANELKEVEMGIRPVEKYRKERASRRKSTVEFSVASIEERNKAWRIENGTDTL